jgi:ATP-binding cassette subfamily F protein 3
VSLLTASRVGKSYGPDDIFSEITVEIPSGARIALVGPNGAGKTTLLNLLIKHDDPSAGVVNHSRGLRIGFLPQRPELHGDRTLWEEMLTVFTGVRQQESDLAELAHQLSDAQRPDHEAIVERYGRLQEAFETAGGYDYETRIKTVLTGLGFAADSYTKRLATLSGGQKTRGFLARLLLESPDLLVLDEPTNHLDIAAVEWLEGFLKAFKGAVLVVSHDRYFMDHVATIIWELDWGILELYHGNYTAYVRQREERHTRRWAEYETQQEKIAKEEEYIRRNIAGQNTRQAKGRLKRLDRLKRDELLSRPRQSRAMNLKLSTAIRSGDKVVMTNALSVGYPDSTAPLFSVPDVTLFRGEVAAVIGGNGVGKTTFLKTLLSKLSPHKGEVRFGAQIKIGYFAQAHESLDPNQTILDEVMSVRPMLISEARSYLGMYLFSGDEVYRPVGTLSGGERGRVALAKLALDGANVLLLDEPTNHLDIAAQEVLQAVLSDFNGTVLLVSHDRYLIDALATQIWHIEAGRLTVFEGNYQEYIEFREAAKIAAQPKPVTPVKTVAATKNGKSGNSDTRPLSKWERDKRTAAVEDAIQQLESTIKQITTDLATASATGSVESVRELGAKYESAQAALDEKLIEWEALVS